MSDVKLIRKQVLNVLQTHGKELFNETTFKVGLEALQNQVNGRLTELEKHVKETLQKIEERNKDVQNFIMRAVTTPAPQEAVVEPTKTE